MVNFDIEQVRKLSHSGTAADATRLLKCQYAALKSFANLNGVVFQTFRRSSLTGDESVERYKRRLAAKNKHAPHLRKARNAVRSAIKNGYMYPADCYGCVFCHRLADIWHHHKGYKPQYYLEVISVCRIHHALTHRKKLNFPYHYLEKKRVLPSRLSL